MKGHGYQQTPTLLFLSLSLPPSQYQEIVEYYRVFNFISSLRFWLRWGSFDWNLSTQIINILPNLNVVVLFLPLNPKDPKGKNFNPPTPPPPLFLTVTVCPLVFLLRFWSLCFCYLLFFSTVFLLPLPSTSSVPRLSAAILFVTNLLRRVVIID